ncbi:glycosyl transferases group 1-domain-containing protein [Chaetomidium leptoderma]|uniref:Chitobiosyldiphosphodolichol beta-mannosyltransferase n=1 Tax=Chaetomidium leptoderma TaxID=669021 RepID=A0AAN6VII2_9PEZI|nr:glycosyl transferases group 1-domain-containing protein [Chaetomidium leptoderma]
MDTMLMYFLFFCALGVIALAGAVAFFILGLTKYNGPPAGSSDGSVSVHVLVLGDIGRSPRMTYHALSIAKHGGTVKLIGYLETSPHPDVANSPNITITPLPAPPHRPASIPFILFAPWKVLYQVYHLTHLLAHTLPPAQWILIQNPPSIPTLAVASLICRLRNSKLIIDWHNYGWTILAGTRGANHPLVALAKRFECHFGRLGSLHLTVTHAMARQLRSPPYSITQPMMAVHDRPATIFQPLTLAPSSSPPSTRTRRKKEILQRVLPTQAEQALIPHLLDGTTRLIVSSTSWTPDEDFSLLLDALTLYAAQPQQTVTPLLAIITGQGPQKAHYLEQIAALTAAGLLPNVRIATAFLPFADYAALLACADLGVCLHKSSSGVDLPMKVVDMFGAGLPVAAYAGYESFGELVKEGENGRGFEKAGELAGILGRLLGGGGGGDRAELERLRRGALKEGSRRWDEEWDSRVGRVMGLVS